MPVPIAVQLRRREDGELEIVVRSQGRTATLKASVEAFSQEVTGNFEDLRGERPSGKRLRRVADLQARRCAEGLGGHAQAGSGAKAGHKGDGRVIGRYRIENKFTMARSFRLELADLVKIRAECSGLEVPVFEVEFKEPGTLRTIDRWALIPYVELERLNEQAINKG